MELCSEFEIFEEHYASSKLERYSFLERLGEGTFGEVKKAVDKISGKIVAIKFVRILSKKNGVPKAVFREMESLKQLSQSEFIMRLYDVYSDEGNLCLVMEYVVSDLGEVISRSKQALPRSHLKSFYSMILSGMYFCHSRNIIHRDIKPANLLLSSSGVVKLADFGLARIFDGNNGGSLSHQVATRQYRAPELLFASRHYTLAVDMWSVGVVMAELATLQAMFPGNNDIDQMYRVFQVMGSPTTDVWPGVDKLPDYCKVNFPNMLPLDLSVVFPGVHQDDISFIAKFIVLDPASRLSAAQALRDDYFTTAPLPAPASCLYVPLRPNNNTSTNKNINVLAGAGKQPVTSVDSFINEIVANINIAEDL